jgi:hypothetical protein
MRNLTTLAAAIATTFVIVGSAGATSGFDKMVGGGWVEGTELLTGADIKVREGMVLYCNTEANSNLQVTWGSGYFHLANLTIASCSSSNDPQFQQDGGTIAGDGPDEAFVNVDGDAPGCQPLAPLQTLRGGNFTYIDNTK